MRKAYDFSKGRRGAVSQETGKTRITIFLDDDVIERFKGVAAKSGKGYQTLINEALRRQLSLGEARLTASMLRKIVREELSRG